MPVPTQEQLAAYAAAPERLAAAVAGLSDEQCRYSPTPGDWSIHEVLVHLADSEGVYFERMRRILVEEQPPLRAFDEGDWALLLDYRTQDRELALALFTALRRSNAALLRAQPAVAWERTGQHSERGPVTLYEIFETLIKHADAHLAQIEELKRSLASSAS